MTHSLHRTPGMSHSLHHNRPTACPAKAARAGARQTRLCQDLASEAPGPTTHHAALPGTGTGTGTGGPARPGPDAVNDPFLPPDARNESFTASQAPPDGVVHGAGLSRPADAARSSASPVPPAAGPRGKPRGAARP